MFKHHKQPTDEGIPTTVLIDECQKLLGVVLEDEKHLEKYASVRLLHEDTNRVDAWKDYFYPDFKINVNSPSKKLQWLNLRRMLIKEIQTTITYGALFSDKFSDEDSEQLIEEYMKNIKTSDFGTIEELKQFISVQFTFSEISMILLRNLFLKCFNDFSDYLDLYVRLYSNMMEQIYMLKLKKKTSADITVEYQLFELSARLVLGTRKRICNGEPWATDDGGLFTADEKDISDIFKF